MGAAKEEDVRYAPSRLGRSRDAAKALLIRAQAWMPHPLRCMPPSQGCLSQRPAEAATPLQDRHLTLEPEPEEPLEAEPEEEYREGKPPPRGETQAELPGMASVTAGALPPPLPPLASVMPRLPQVMVQASPDAQQRRRGAAARGGRRVAVPPRAEREDWEGGLQPAQSADTNAYGDGPLAKQAYAPDAAVAAKRQSNLVRATPPPPLSHCGLVILYSPSLFHRAHSLPPIRRTQRRGSQRSARSASGAEKPGRQGRCRPTTQRVLTTRGGSLWTSTAPDPLSPRLEGRAVRGAARGIAWTAAPSRRLGRESWRRCCGGRTPSLGRATSERLRGYPRQDILQAFPQLEAAATARAGDGARPARG